MIKIEDLFKKYNRVLCKTFYPETCKGWDHLVEDCIEELNTAASAYKNNAITVTNIKEKFGGMRIYVDYDLPDEQIVEIERIVSKYEHLSLKTCTICSSEENQMHPRRGYWDMVICENCYKDHNNGK